jgi:photosystem II stability/assembly factor-like uncharacterized protein
MWIYSSMPSRIIIIILFVFTSFSQLSSQNIFQLLYPNVTPEPVFVISSNSSNLFLAGAYGLFLRSLNGGMNWIEFNNFSKSDLRFNVWQGMSAGLLCTADSNLYRTTNSGINWVHTLKFGLSVNDIKYMGSGGIFMCAYNLTGKSSNGGLNWTYFLPDSGTVNNYQSCYFLDSATGYLAALELSTNYTFILKSVNSGALWNKYNTTIDNFIIRKFFFINSFTGWAAGERFGNVCLIKTTNGGLNWTEQYPNTNDARVNGLYFSNSNSGFISTNLNILRTSNSGNNWSVYISDYGITASNFSNDSLIYFSDSRGRFIRVNGLGQVDTLLGQKNFRLDKITFASTHNIYISGANYKNFRTTNGGANWNYDYTAGSAQIKTMFFTGPSTGFAIAGRGSVLSTVNFGNNWQAVYDTTAELNNLFFLNPSTGWITGNGLILKTTNTGLNWQGNYLRGDMLKIWFGNSSSGYAIMNDSIQKSTNGGDSWYPLNNNHAIDFCFTNISTGWSLNYADSITEIRKTTNGGLNYSFCSKLPNSIYKLQFIDALIGYSSDNNIVWRTTDAGITWKSADYPKSEYLNINDFWFSDANTGWFCGDNSIVLNTTTGSSINIYEFTFPSSDECLSVYNYPNPFNNQTKILYALPVSGKVFIKVYNILGQEVFSFISEFQSKGNHALELNSGGLASGIYFISLKTQQYKGFTRMVIIK